MDEVWMKVRQNQLDDPSIKLEKLDKWKDPWAECGVAEHRLQIEDLRDRNRKRETEIQEAAQLQLQRMQEELKAAKAELLRRNDKPREVEAFRPTPPGFNGAQAPGLVARCLELGKANKNLFLWLQRQQKTNLFFRARCPPMSQPSQPTAEEEFLRWAVDIGALGLHQVSITYLEKNGVLVRSLVAAKEVTEPILLPRNLLLMAENDMDLAWRLARERLSCYLTLVAEPGGLAWRAQPAGWADYLLRTFLVDLELYGILKQWSSTVLHLRLDLLRGWLLCALASFWRSSTSLW
eukprot:s628_g16.t1